MNNKAMVLMVTILGACAGTSFPAAAHHGAAAFDTERITQLPAVVVELDWRNPHALLRFDVVDESGASSTWTAETAGLVILLRAGWTRDVIKPGDRVVVFGHRAVNGSHTMLLKRLVLPTGRELTSIIPSR